MPLGTAYAQLMRIMSLKALSNKGGIMQAAYDLVQEIIGPDQPRAKYTPQTTVTFTENLYKIEYISPQDSIMRAKVRLRYLGNQPTVDSWFNRNFHLPTLAFGMAGLVKQLRMDYGPIELQNLDFYNVYAGIVTETSAFKHHFDEQTLFNCNERDVPYLRFLHNPEPSPVDGEVAYRVSKWCQGQVPMFCAANKLGFLPNYMMGNRLKLNLVLAPQHMPFTSTHHPTIAHQAGWYPGKTDGTYVADQQFQVYKLTGGDDMLPNSLRYLSDVTAATWHMTHPDNHPYSGRDACINTANWSWETCDWEYMVHGLRELPGSGAKLDAEPIQVYTKDVICMTQESTGATREHFVFPFMRSCINNVICVPLDPNYADPINFDISTNDSVGSIRRPIDLWMRGGRIGNIQAVQGNTYSFEAASDGAIASFTAIGMEEMTYDRSINPLENQIYHFQWKMAQASWPHATGTGTDNYTDYDQNVPFMYMQLLRLLGRNFTQGEASQPQLRCFDPYGHGLLRDCTSSFKPSVGAATAPYERATYSDLALGDRKSDVFMSNPLWYGYTPTLYGGYYPQFHWFPENNQEWSAYWWQGEVAEYTSADIERHADLGRYPNFIQVLPYSSIEPTEAVAVPFLGSVYGGDEEENQMTGASNIVTAPRCGGKFLMAQSFTPVDHEPSWIQGIDTGRIDLSLIIQRRKALQQGKFLYWGAFGSWLNGAPKPKAQYYKRYAKIYEITPLMVCYATFDKRFVVHAGAIEADQ